MIGTSGANMGAKPFLLPVLAVSVLCLLLCAVPARAEWETGARVGFDSNVDRAVTGADAQSDSYLSAHLSFVKGPSGESRLNWAFEATVLGAAYARLSDLSFGQLSVSPALVYFPHRSWSISIAPFLEGKIVGDPDQSALAFGAKVMMRQQLHPKLYLGEYYVYRDSRAHVDTYSYTENALGIILGVNWARNVFTELSYEYSYGDSFRTVGSSSSYLTGQGQRNGQGQGRGQGSQKGRDPTYSSTFNQVIVREKVDRHAVGILLGIDWTAALFSTAGYTYTTWSGDSGSSISHTGSISLGYRF